MAVTGRLSDKAMHEPDNIKFITHLPGNDFVGLLFYIQEVFLSVEFKRKKMANRLEAPAFFSSYHFALIVSEKMKRCEIKGVIIKQSCEPLESRHSVGFFKKPMKAEVVRSKRL